MTARERLMRLYQDMRVDRQTLQEVESVRKQLKSRITRYEDQEQELLNEILTEAMEGARTED